MPYRVELKNLLPQTIPDLGITILDGDFIRFYMTPHVSLNFDIETYNSITDQTWNLIEKERILLRVCGYVVRSRKHVWPRECLIVGDMLYEDGEPMLYEYGEPMLYEDFV